MEKSDTVQNQAVRQIKLYMANTGSTQYEVAAEIGAPPQTVNRWLQEKVNISNAYLAVLKANGIIKK